MKHKFHITFRNMHLGGLRGVGALTHYTFPGALLKEWATPTRPNLVPKADQARASILAVRATKCQISQYDPIPRAAIDKTFVADQEINMVACLTEIMASCKFK